MYAKHVVFYIILAIFQIAVMGKRSGPYKLSLVKVDPCSSEKTTKPLDPNPPVTFVMELYTVNNVTLAKGKATIHRDFQAKKTKIKGYLWEGNDWKVNFQVTNMGCNRVFFPAFAAAIGLPFDIKTCTIYKGVYPFSGININKIEHTYNDKAEYGKTLWSLELFSNTGTIICYQFERLTEPI